MNPESSTEYNPPNGIIEQACQVLMNALKNSKKLRTELYDKVSSMCENHRDPKYDPHYFGRFWQLN
jgi:hypothetical protein